MVVINVGFFLLEDISIIIHKDISDGESFALTRPI